MNIQTAIAFLKEELYTESCEKADPDPYRIARYEDIIALLKSIYDSGSCSSSMDI